MSNIVFGISEDYFKKVIGAVKPIEKFYKSLLLDDIIMDVVDGSLPNQIGNKENKLQVLLFADIMKNLNRLGHSAVRLKNKEGFAIVALYFSVFSADGLKRMTYSNIDLLGDYADVVASLISYIENAFNNYPEDDFLFISQVLSHCKRENLRFEYLGFLYDFFSVVASADNIITDTELRWLDKLSTYKTRKTSVETRVTTKETKHSVKPIDKLNSLIGLNSVKEEIKNLSNLVKIQKMREERGMKTSPISYHCVFTGNPGTGKTTVARIVAEIYKDLGVIKRGHLIETDRSGLVGEYVGQTAPKTNAIIDSALDGVLFIDEAYSLVQGGGNDYGKEAISTLLKRMEDDRERLVVILAGYSKEMEVFINSNSGLQSRFNRYIYFPDYSLSELMRIFQNIIEGNDFRTTDEALSCVKQILQQALSNKDEKFGNARFVRNLFEKVITQQANRLSMESDITNEMLSMIEVSDILNCI